MRRSSFALVAACALGACRGAVPPRNAPPEQAISAVLIGGRLILPSGETRNGELEIGFESEGGRDAEVYRLPVRGGEFYLYLIEPGNYRLAPTRGFFGVYKSQLELRIEDRNYRLPFPRELTRQRAVQVRPAKIVSMGIIEAKVLPALPGQTGAVRVRLDDSLQARRSVVQSLIRDMMNPKHPAEVRDSAIAWSRALQTSLMELLSEEEQRQTFKPAP